MRVERYDHIKKDFVTNEGKKYAYYDFLSLDPSKVNVLPFSIRVLLESAVRNCDDSQIFAHHVDTILNWSPDVVNSEIPFKPSRVLLQDFTGVPAIVDFAAMRDAVIALGHNGDLVNPKCQSDLVVDHSVQVDFTRTPEAKLRNESLEYERNKERFSFLKWGASAFKNMRIVPPGSGIVHQVNLEYLARVCMIAKDESTNVVVYPDSLVGTDSHTTMINGLGVLGWGVGGIEAEAVMLGQPISMLLPQVVGYCISGEVGPWVTSTDIVLTITKHLRQLALVGQFVEFYGPSVSSCLSIADRATISNMCPEYGATCAYFPFDQTSIDYLKQTNRSGEDIETIETYLKKVGLFCYGHNSTQPIKYSRVFHLDLSSVVPSVSGPKRPQDRVAVSDLKQHFQESLVRSPVGFNAFGLDCERVNDKTTVSLTVEGSASVTEYELRHGSVLIAAITSCTNTSNPSVMLGAGLLAAKAIEVGLSVAPYIKTSMSPGSGVVTYYLRESGVLEPLEKLGFGVVGYGCMTCIGNSGPLDEKVSEALKACPLVCCGVLSGNRNFEGRIHPELKANYLASPMLVIAYAIAGRVDIDFETEPLGHCKSTNEPIFLRDVWPSRTRIREVEGRHVIPALFRDVYKHIETGSVDWQNIVVERSASFNWNLDSTYIQRPPFFDEIMARGRRDSRNKDLPPPTTMFTDMRCLLLLGDSVTTDHISPAGNIARNSTAARYLTSLGVNPRQFNSFGSRRGNDQVMTRGTFANIRLVNKLLGEKNTGGSLVPQTIHFPTDQILDIYDVSTLYKSSDTPLLVIAGKDYGSGSSRDWAAKGTLLLGVKAVLAESFERIHRSNLVGMGVIPLQFAKEGENAETLGLTGREKFSFDLGDLSAERSETPWVVDVTASCEDDDKKVQTFKVRVRFDTQLELVYYKFGGILQYMVHKLIGATSK